MGNGHTVINYRLGFSSFEGGGGLRRVGFIQLDFRCPRSGRAWDLTVPLPHHRVIGGTSVVL
jgi:hypothetical protein